MTDETTDSQSQTASEPSPFTVKLAPNTPAPATAEDDSLADVQDDAPATEAAQEEEEDSFLDAATPEEKEKLDLSNPAVLAAYKLLQKPYSRKIQQLRKELPAEPEPQRQEAVAQPQGDDDDPFAVDYSGFTPSISFKGTDLEGYEDVMIPALKEAAVQMGQFTLDQLRNRSNSLAQRQVARTAEQQISDYAHTIKDHPDYEEKASGLASFLQKSKEHALRDPQDWIETAEARFGLRRDWAQTEQASQVEQGRQNRRLADKPRASTPRPTRGPTGAQARASDGTLKGDDAFEAAWKQAGLTG